MKKSTLSFFALLITLSSIAQEWDDPITTTDWNQLWKSSFIQSENAVNGPEASGWFWGINMNHSSNHSNYRYNGQIAIKNSNTLPTLYFRSTTSNGTGIWTKVIHNSGDQSINGSLSIGSTVANSYSKLAIKGPNSPNNSGSYRDISFEFASAGSALIRSYRGSSWDTYIQFLTTPNTGGSPQTRMHIDHIGNVGIGTTTPLKSLHVFSNEDAITWPAVINNNRNSPTVSNYGVGLMLKHSNNGEMYKWGGIASIQEDGWANISGLALYANETEYIRIKGNGNVGIGVTNPDSKLVVDGKIRSEEVKVEIVNGPDYVFEENYELRTLEETKEYISENKHLPEIPSAVEMEANGIDLGDMNMKLLKKVEELTLYLIEQNKQLEKANENITDLQKAVSALKN